MRSRRARAGEWRLVVDPVACDGIGICARVARDLIELDRWGFPLVPSDTLGAGSVRPARRAARACPKRALHVVPVASAES